MKQTEFVIREFLDRIAEAEQNPVDSITVDVPLFIRLLEYAKEDAQSDMDLHDLAERIISLSTAGQTLTMDNYDSIVGADTNTVTEDASGGGTSSGGIASVIPGDGGFGKSIFMSRTEPKTIKKTKRK